MSDSINWLREIEDVPSKAIDPLAAEVMRRFNGAVGWQSVEQVNGQSLRTVLQNCWEQQNGLLSCEDLKRAAALGVDVVVNITALKVGIANAYLTDALASGTSELPWIIQPTPRPDISPIAKDAILQEVKLTLFGQNPDMPMGYRNGEEIVDAVRQAKRFYARREMEVAERAAKEMTLLIEDQCAEGGLARAITDFLQYFPVYPYAVFAGPYITRAPRLVWGKKKPRISTEVYPTFRAISPFDFCYSPDSPDTQRGTCVFTRTLWTRKELMNAAKLATYLQDNILDVLKDADSNTDFDLHWLSHAPDSPQRDLAMWSSNVSPLEILTHYGVFSGRELSKYGFTGLDDTEFYNSEIAMAGYRVIQVKVISDPNIQTRPVYTASFYRTGGDRIAGDGIAQRLRGVERAYMASLQYLMRNAANASAPMCEADYKRIVKYMAEEDLGNVVPGLMYMADSDMGNSNNPALRFFNIPSNIPAYVSLMQMFEQLSDRVTNIPAALHGEAVGSGAMRTFRGMSMLIGNATKAMHSAVSNMSSGIFDPMGHYLYNINMLYSPDSDVKGDAQIVTKGAEGILQKEMERQTATEILQMLGAVGAQLGQFVNLGPGLAWAVKKLFGAMGMPDDIVVQMAQPVAPAQAGGGQGVGAIGAVPNGNPDSPTGAGPVEDVSGVSMSGPMADNVM